MNVKIFQENIKVAKINQEEETCSPSGSSPAPPPPRKESGSSSPDHDCCGDVDDGGDNDDDGDGDNGDNDDDDDKMGDRLVVTCPSLRWTRGLGRRQFSLRDFFRTRVTFLPGNGLLASFARKEESFVDPALPFDFGKGSLSSNELGSFCFTSAVFALSLMSTQRSPEEPFEVEPFSRKPACSPRSSVGA